VLIGGRDERRELGGRDRDELVHFGLNHAEIPSPTTR
jgi:hypothetical protein